MVTINEQLNITELRTRLHNNENRYVALVDLCNNFLPDIKNMFPAWFQNVSTLKLSNCNCMKISRFAFTDLVNVETVFLDNNCLRRLPSKLFETCSRLRTLSLRSNHFQNMPVSCLKGAPALRELDLSDNKLFCIRFCHMKNLEVLNLSKNLIAVFEANRFENLLVLNMSSNIFRIVNGSLSQTMPSLIDVDLSNNQIVSLRNTSFAFAPNLKSLRLNNNCFEKFTTEVLSRDCRLRCLELDNNELKSLILEDDVAVHFETLSLANNLNCIFVKFGMLKNLKRLNFSGSSFYSKCLPRLFNSCDLEHFNFADNHIHKIPNGYFTSFKKLKYLSLDNSSAECISSITEPLFMSENALKHLSISNCGLPVVVAPLLRFLVHLTYLNLSRNKISELDSVTFADLKELRHLYLNINELTEFHPDIFGALVHLKTIDLTDNPIIRIDRRLFAACSRAMKLFIDESVEHI